MSNPLNSDQTEPEFHKKCEEEELEGGNKTKGNEINEEWFNTFIYTDSCADVNSELIPRECNDADIKEVGVQDKSKENEEVKDKNDDNGGDDEDDVPQLSATVSCEAASGDSGYSNRKTDNKSPRILGRSFISFPWQLKGKSKSLDQSELEDEKDSGCDKSSEKEFDWLYPKKPDFITLGDDKEESSSSPKSPFQRMEGWLFTSLKDTIHGFSDTSNVVLHSGEEGDPLTIKKLKENVVRFSSAMEPLWRSFKFLQDVIRWKNPYLSLVILLSYIYALVFGWALTLLFAIAIAVLTKNYLNKKTFRIPILNIYLWKDEPSDEVDGNSDVGFGDKFYLVVHVARKVQNLLGVVSDMAEKIKNLLLWEPGVTSQLYLILWIMLLTSLLITCSQIFTVVGVYLGLKFFLLDFLYNRFPNLWKRRETTKSFWESIPTDTELDKKNKFRRNQSSSEVDVFLEVFNLPTDEKPLLGWEGGKRCSFIHRDRTLASALKKGKLYLTKSYFCFERNKSNTEKNISLLLTDIKFMEKSNNYPWILGGGMTLELTLNNDKVYLFGGMCNRDEIYDSIMVAATGLGHEILREKHPSTNNDRNIIDDVITNLDTNISDTPFADELLSSDIPSEIEEHALEKAEEIIGENIDTLLTNTSRLVNRTDEECEPSGNNMNLEKIMENNMDLGHLSRNFIGIDANDSVVKDENADNENNSSENSEKFVYKHTIRLKDSGIDVECKTEGLDLENNKS